MGLIYYIILQLSRNNIEFKKHAQTLLIINYVENKTSNTKNADNKSSKINQNKNIKKPKLSIVRKKLKSLIKTLIKNLRKNSVDIKKNLKYKYITKKHK